MSNRKPKSRRPKDKHRKNIPNHVKDTVVKLRAMGEQYNTIANKTNISYQSVVNILTKWAPQNTDRVKEAQAKALEEIASKVYGKAKEALDNITQDSMTHDRVEQRNADGQLIGVQHSGPNALQLATTAGILLDKGEKINENVARLRGESTGQIGPTDFANLIASIGDRLGRLGELKANINTGEIEARLVELKDKVISAEYEVIEDEDGD